MSTTRSSPIPKAVVLPYGYEITVVRGDCGDAWGLWDDATRTITLDPGLRKRSMARYILEHELEHAWVDWKKWVRQHMSVENPDGATEEPSEDMD